MLRYTVDNISGGGVGTDASFYTGLYTNAAYCVIKAVLLAEHIRKPSPVRRRGIFIRELPDSWLWARNIPCLDKEFTRIAPDGEIYFTVRFMPKPEQLTAKKMANAIARSAESQRAWIFDPEKRAEHDERVYYITRHIQGKLTPEEQASEAYKRWIGIPLDPFKQAALKMKRDAFKEEALRIQKCRTAEELGVPEDYRPNSTFRASDWVSEHMTKLYFDYLSCLQ